MPSPFPGMNPYLEQPGLWSGFHTSFLTFARETITAQVSPRYVVKIEHHVFIHDPAGDRDSLGRPDLSVHEVGGGVAVAPARSAAAAPWWVGLPDVDDEEVGRLEIRDRLSREVISVVELLSPVNKNTGSKRDQYLAKVNRVLASRAALVEIDLLRGGPRMPWTDLPPCSYYVVVSRPADRAADPPRAEVWPARLRERLPEITIPLRPDEAGATLDLQAVVHRVYDSGGYGDSIYQSPPEPRLTPDAAAWAADLIPPPVG